MSDSTNCLKRQIGLFGTIMLVVGHVIGSGIFITPGTVAVAAGAFGPNMLSWVIGGICAVLCALLYVELGSMMPRVGGAYVYIKEAFGNGPAFAYGWSMMFGSHLPLIAMFRYRLCYKCSKTVTGVDSHRTKDGGVNSYYFFGNH